jgi:hypothetical protein
MTTRSKKLHKEYMRQTYLVAILYLQFNMATTILSPIYSNWRKYLSQFANPQGQLHKPLGRWKLTCHLSRQRNFVQAPQNIIQTNTNPPSICIHSNPTRRSWRFTHSGTADYEIESQYQPIIPTNIRAGYVTTRQDPLLHVHQATYPRFNMSNGLVKPSIA